MVYRIHFTVQDLARTRVAKAPVLEAQLDLAARTLQDRSQPVRLDPWRRRATAQLSAAARMALSLIPPVGWSPTFAFSRQGGTYEELFEQVLVAPRKRINEALASLARFQSVPSWTLHLADDKDLRKQYVAGLADLYTVLLAPYQRQLTELFVADRAVRMRQLLDGGIEQLLAKANPQRLRWSPPVLEIRMVNGVDHELHLNGQGILLVPSMFSSRTVVDQAQPQPVVTYPVGNDLPLSRLTALAPEPAVARSESSVSALLGSTRAAVLNTIAENPGCSTKELATLAGIAPASASEHATVLRQTGLINTIRDRNTVLHSPSDLGTAFLNETIRRSNKS